MHIGTSDIPQKIKSTFGIQVGDIILANSSADCESSCNHLRKSVPTTSLEELKNFAGYVFGRDWAKGALNISQRASIDQLAR